MFLSDQDILAQQKEAPIIEPFDEAQLSAASYDVTLGSDAMSFDSLPMTITFEDQALIDSCYRPVSMENGLLLKPQQYILVSLKEKIVVPDDCVAQILPRTRYTRAGLLVAGQYCNPGYSGNLWIGVRNVSPNNMQLRAGMRIAQAVFEKVVSRPSESRLYRNQRHAEYYNELAFVGSRIEPMSESAQNLYDKVMSSLSAEQ